ncbi:Os04g0151866 [Oryza sativa Japonica Group]|uniref:Os04g0151866 protein n=1 Tax=Oryza sativa subsp. japonica TaxID=39947 RepID=A0A0P0W744_ORYSJ|nr:Os04g0151866 [Oryza sativa Japonica Group]
MSSGQVRLSLVATLVVRTAMGRLMEDNDGSAVVDGRRHGARGGGPEERGAAVEGRRRRAPAAELYTSSRGGGGSPVWRQLSSGTTLVSSPEVALVLLLHAVRTHLAGRQQGDDERWRTTQSKKQQHIKGHGTTSSGGL